MSKSVLVMDMPNSCNDCVFHNYHFCNITGENIDKNLYDLMEYKKPNTCPLKELPDERHNDLEYDGFMDGYDDGWNEFRDRILGENNNV